jgi:hypothetical protein
VALAEWVGTGAYIMTNDQYRTFDISLSGKDNRQYATSNQFVT